MGVQYYMHSSTYTKKSNYMSVYNCSRIIVNKIPKQYTYIYTCRDISEGYEGKKTFNVKQGFLVSTIYMRNKIAVVGTKSAPCGIPSF